MQIIRDKISLDELKEMSKKMQDNLVKVVVDTERHIMAVDAGMHAEEEEELLEDGSLQEHLWGINIYPYESADNWIEFDSMINMRPSYGNRTRGVDDVKTQEIIKKIVNSLVLK
ncbi:MAG TPA: DUF5674 family protein [Candidatus Babeliales bacterium]|nr:DUF5674 family protein [Candidatus Babeliales bacterium]